MSNHETMRTLGRIAQVIYPGRDIPQNVLDTVLSRPEAGLALMLKGVSMTKRLGHVVGTLPAPMPRGPISIEDQGGFWLGWYGQRGGARAGAGRPTEVEGAKRMNVTLDEATVEAAKALGNGNLSAGLRAAVKLAASAESKQ